jgi:hypothetical protein
MLVILDGCKGALNGVLSQRSRWECDTVFADVATQSTVNQRKGDGRGRTHFSPSFQSSASSHGDAPTKPMTQACTSLRLSHPGALAPGHSSVADGARIPACGFFMGIILS